MQIGLVQCNTVIGDFDGNTRAVLQGYRRAVDEGAEVVLAPELVVCGYPPRDLIFRSRFVDGNRRALERMAGETGDTPLVAGFIAVNETGTGKPWFNAAAVMRRGRVEAVVSKCLLPTYDVFDEARYFQPAAGTAPVEVAGMRLGITICEDIWTEDYLPSRLYVDNPPGELAAAGIDVLLNLSASPYHCGKPAARRRMLCGLAKELRVPIAYCNAIGGHDQLVFDGHSLVIGADGGVIAGLAGFEQQVAVVDVGLSRAGRGDGTGPVVGGGVGVGVGVDAAMSAEDLDGEIYRALVLGTRDYMRKCGFKTAVLGLSGGIDSALTAAIAADAVGGANVLGVLMPSRYSSQHSLDDARALAANFGMPTREVPIEPMFAAVRESLAPVFEGREEDVTEENMQSRLRGLTVMSISNKFGRLLLTTGNKSELAVGYCTIYGDMCGGLAVISDLPKTRVFSVSRWRNRDGEMIPWSSIEKPPSAELRPDQFDQDSLPPYDLLDRILELLVEQSLSVQDVVERGFDADTVRGIQRLIDVNEWKRHQAAPGLRVTSKAFGIGRRIPIAQRYS